MSYLIKAFLFKNLGSHLQNKDQINHFIYIISVFLHLKLIFQALYIVHILQCSDYIRIVTS